MEDFDNVLKFWGPVEADYNGCGSLVLTGLFMKHPETQKMFPKFVNIPQSDLASNQEVATQGGLALKRVGDILKAKGKHDDLLDSVVKTHYKHNISIPTFRLIVDVVVNVMKDKTNIDPKGQESLRKLLGIVIDEISVRYDKLDSKA